MSFDSEFLPGELLSEERLRQISKSIRGFIPSVVSDDGQLEEQLKRLHTHLNDVLYTSASSVLTSSHRVAAWNALCSFIDQCVESNLADVRRVLWDENYWRRAFGVYLERAQNARPKSSKQLLTTLINALRKADDATVVSLKSDLVTVLLDHLSDYKDAAKAKASAQFLGAALAKNVLDVEQLTPSYALLGTDDQNFKPQQIVRQALTTLFIWFDKADFGATIAHFTSILLERLGKAEGLKIRAEHPIWVCPLEEAVAQGGTNFNDLRVHLFPVLFKRDFEGFVSFLHSRGIRQGSSIVSSSSFMSTRTQQELLFTALQAGKEMGFLQDTEASVVHRDATTVFVPWSLTKSLLLQQSRVARLTGLSLLITSPSTSKPLPTQALDLIRASLRRLFGDSDADFRSDVASSFQRLVDRLRAVTAMSSRNSPSNPRNGTGSDQIHSASVLDNHKRFLHWLLKFLAWELRPTASYQRHISSLKCLLILTRSGLDRNISDTFLSKSASGEIKWPFHLDILTFTLRRLLLDCLLDPFDDVRQTASSILHMYSSSKACEDRQDFSKQLQFALSRAERIMLETGRADQADGMSYTCALHYQHSGICEAECETPGSSKHAIWLQRVTSLEEMLDVAAKDISTAVKKHPLHGLLISLRLFLNYDNSLPESGLHDRLFECLHRVWQIVKPVLCNDAPEGYLPEDEEEVSNSTKEMLSYCWRALKEASLLLGTLISLQRDSSGPTGFSALEQMSNLCFTQLAELRHRGAFSTVAQTWMATCIRCQNLKSPTGSFLLEVWYERTLNMLRNNVTINTRRSAGLPALLCGVLVADQSERLFMRAFLDLEAIARQLVDPIAMEEGSLSQVHAMNCIKDVLKNSRLGERSERYLSTALRLAADSLRSDAWAIRNCGLMLFRAVIDRLLGTSEAHLDQDKFRSRRISLAGKPQLLDVLLSLLLPHSGPASGTFYRNEGVFPALQLLQHSSVPADRLLEVKKIVFALTESNSWHIRDKAAQTYAILADPEKLSSKVTDLLNVDARHHNALHGALLTARHILARTRSLPASAKQAVQANAYGSLGEHNLMQFIAQARELYHNDACMVTKAACIDVIRECRMTVAHLFASDNAEDAFAPFSSPVSSDRSFLDPTAAVLRQAWARLCSARMTSTGETESLTLQIIELAEHDPNACIQFLRNIPSASNANVVYGICAQLQDNRFSIELRCETQQTILDMSTRSTSKSPFSVAGRISDLISGDTEVNQRFVDQWLILRAIDLEHRLAVADGENDWIYEWRYQDVAEWAEACVSAVNGEGLFTREAAAQALSRISSWQKLIASFDESQLAAQRLMIAVYDLLNDDDEDVRILAAQITRCVLTGDGQGSSAEIEPIVASQKLLAFCVSRWPTSSALATTALKRMSGISNDNPASVTQRLAASLRGDTALFAEEKQNLYIDDASEVRVWSQVLQRLSPHSMAKSFVSKLARWVDEGLNALETHAGQNVDGPLGWSTKPEVFTLGLQVIYGAETLFCFVKQGIRLPVRSSELRRKLFGLRHDFKADDVGGVNCLWIWELDRVLETSVLDKLKAVRQSLEHVK